MLKAQDRTQNGLIKFQAQIEVQDPSEACSRGRKLTEYILTSCITLNLNKDK